MSAQFAVPDWMARTMPAPAPSMFIDGPEGFKNPEVDPHRVESLVNRFIAGKQESLFTAPGAYYRTTGADAVDGAPAIYGRLNALRDTTLDAAADDGLRAVLGPRLDLHLADAFDGIDRHVQTQREALARQILTERQTLLQRAAALEPSDDNKLDGLAEANAGAARELARINGEPETRAIEAARSAIWRTAIDQRLASGNGPPALALFDRVAHLLGPTDRLSLETALQIVRRD